MLICPEASNAQNSIAAVSADGSTVWVLILRLNSSCNRSMAWRQTREGEEPVTGFLQAVGDGAVLEPPFADEGRKGPSNWVGSKPLLRMSPRGPQSPRAKLGLSAGGAPAERKSSFACHGGYPFSAAGFPQTSPRNARHISA